jgi:ribosomal-protein-alanine N-acetyltransferase
MKTKRAKTETSYIRWMIRKDLSFVLNIEESSFEFPWTEDEFIHCLRQRANIGMVAEIGEDVVGYMIYGLHKNRIDLLTLAVHPSFRKQGIGRSMIEKLISKLEYQRRNRITTEVRETNLAAQLFLRQMGFRATDIRRNAYDNTPEDAYQMIYRTNLSA